MMDWNAILKQYFVEYQSKHIFHVFGLRMYFITTLLCGNP